MNQSSLTEGDRRVRLIGRARAIQVALIVVMQLPFPAIAENVPEIAIGQRQLFMDDEMIAKTDHLKRTMHSPRKLGAVIRSPKSTETIQTRSAPVWDREARIFKLWVLGVEDTLWQSVDGLHWTPGPRPNMRTDNVIYDPHETNPAQRFKAALLNEGFAVSPDGVQWTKLDIPKITSSDEGNFSYDPVQRLYLHTVKRGGRFGRSVAIATSRDFQKWSDHGVVFQTDEQDQELGRKRIQARATDPTFQQTAYDSPNVYNIDIYNMGVFGYEGLYLGLPALYHATGPVPNYPNTDGFHLIELVCSRDLKTWQRLGDRQPFMGPSRRDSGAYDLTQILPPSDPVVRDDELWFYYTGLKYRANWTYTGTYPNGEAVPMPGKDRDVGAVCLSVLRRDGFISLDAGDEPGTLSTKPFVLRGNRMHVNVDAMLGELIVTVLNGNGDTVAISKPVSSDNLRSALQWKTGDLASLDGQTVSLRFTLRNASFYSFWSERESP